MIAIIGKAVVGYFVKKIVAKGSEGLIHEILDTLMKHIGPWFISWLRKKAKSTVGTLDDTAVNVLEEIIKGLQEEK